MGVAVGPASVLMRRRADRGVVHLQPGHVLFSTLRQHAVQLHSCHVSSRVQRLRGSAKLWIQTSRHVPTLDSVLSALTRLSAYISRIYSICIFNAIYHYRRPKISKKIESICTNVEPRHGGCPRARGAGPVVVQLGSRAVI